MDNDTLHLINIDLDETMTYLNERLKKSEKRLDYVYISSCCKTLGKYLY